MTSTHENSSAIPYLSSLEFDEYKAALPQNLLSRFGYAQHIGERLVVACDHPANQSVLGELSDRKYEVALLASRSSTYVEMAEELDISTATARTHINKTYEIFDNHIKRKFDQRELAAQVPIDHAELNSYPVEKLSDKEEEVFYLLADGYCNKQIALSLGSAVSTVRTHMRNMGMKLGISGNGDKVAVQIRRIAGAHKVNEIHYNAQQRVKEAGLPEYLISLMSKAQASESKKEISPLDSPVVHTTTNRGLYEKLRKEGYLTDPNLAPGQLNLAGLLAALLLKNSVLESLVTDRDTKSVVQAYIRDDIAKLMQTRNESSIIALDQAA